VLAGVRARRLASGGPNSLAAQVGGVGRGAQSCAHHFAVFSMVLTPPPHTHTPRPPSPARQAAALIDAQALDDTTYLYDLGNTTRLFKAWWVPHTCMGSASW
jgi:hypothetical protein